MKKMNFTTVFAIAAFAMFASLAACSAENTAGTDEQQNSLTAKVDTLALDSALTEWLATDTLTAYIQQSGPCVDCPHDISIIDTSNTQPPKIQVENGELYHVVNGSFESIVCETDSNWFVYSVSIADTVTQKSMTLPDTVSVEIFKKDCASEGGLFVSDTAAVIKGQHNHNCNLEANKQQTETETRQYVDPNWKKYVELVVGICRN